MCVWGGGVRTKKVCVCVCVWGGENKKCVCVGGVCGGGVRTSNVCVCGGENKKCVCVRGG